MSDSDSQNRAEAVPLLIKAAELGFPRAQAALADVYFLGVDAEQDNWQAIYWLKKAAENGDAISQYKLASAYSEGRIMDRDYQKAVEWHRKAATQERNLDAQIRSTLALALLLSACPEEKIRDGNAAMELAKKACAAAPNGSAVEVLAAAYGRCGRFGEAVEQEKKWMKLLEDVTSLPPEAKENLLSLAKERLQLYQHHEAYTTPEE